VADERGRSRAAGPLAALIRTGERTGGGLAASGDGAALRLWTGGVGAPVRSQRELGIAAAGAGGASAGDHPAAGARGQNRGASSDEISGASGAPKPGRLPTHGGNLRPAALRYAGSRATVRGLAKRHAGDPPTHSGESRAVFQNPAAGAGESSASARRRVDPRSGDSGRDRKPRASATGRRSGHGTGSRASRYCPPAGRPD
jgi:hypothetical protein